MILVIARNFEALRRRSSNVERSNFGSIKLRTFFFNKFIYLLNCAQIEVAYLQSIYSLGIY